MAHCGNLPGVQKNGRRPALRYAPIAKDSIIAMLGQKSEDEFLGDEVLRYAVAHKLTVIWEAASRLGLEFRTAYSTIPWPDIVGLRNLPDPSHIDFPQSPQ
jgi:uncharacterized protein with HEPN domain